MMKKVLLTIMTVVTVGLGGMALAPSSAMAVSSVEECQRPFLTFRPWYYGLVEVVDGECKVKTPNVSEDGVGLTTFIWAVVLNIISIIFSLVGYLALGFIIYGGYLYVLARGDPARIAKGKRTVISAIVGLIICILASLISSTIVNIITGATGAGA